MHTIVMCCISYSTYLNQSNIVLDILFWLVNAGLDLFTIHKVNERQNSRC